MKTFRVLPSLVSALVIVLPGLAGAAAADNVIDFQPARTEQRMQMSGGGSARLENLNPAVGSWYVLAVQWPSENRETVYQLDIPVPIAASLALRAEGLEVRSTSASGVCQIFNPGSADFLKNKARQSGGYAPLCGDTVLLLKGQSGSAGGAMEWGANLLRNNLGSWGEGVVDKVKTLRGDADLERGTLLAAKGGSYDANGKPQAAKVDASFSGQVMHVNDLGLRLQGVDSSANLMPGAWYGSATQNGVYFSAIKPNLIDRNLDSTDGLVDPLDSVEADAVEYLVAFDLADYTMGWSHGTKLPGVGWSREHSEQAQTGLAGPDGFSNLSPLSFPGEVNPVYLPKLAATMCGGFQRLQGVFKYGELSKRNYGSYFGFMQEGVVLSRINSGLATAIMYKDGSVDMKTWTDADNAHLNEMRDVRQNAVSLIERSGPGGGGPGLPNRMVRDWGGGAWSGTAEGKLRSARAGVCIAENAGHRYLMYGFFSAATPSAMAKVFHSYGCQYAMHLDMNSAGQGYLGLLSKTANQQFVVEHPLTAMADRDGAMSVEGRRVRVPRYVTPDEADFFYILRKN